MSTHQLVPALHSQAVVFERFERLTREEECDRILQISGSGGYEMAYRVLDAQFKLLHDRAQLLLGLCGVLVSTSVVLMTGKIIARSVLHQQLISPLLVAAGAAAIAAAAIIVGGVLRIRWMSELPGTGVREWVMRSLQYRDSKTFAHRTSIMLLLLSMAMFQVSALLAWMR